VPTPGTDIKNSKQRSETVFASSIESLDPLHTELLHLLVPALTCGLLDTIALSPLLEQACSGQIVTNPSRSGYAVIG
jgi:hypothetical protein